MPPPQVEAETKPKSSMKSIQINKTHGTHEGHLKPY